MSPVRDSRNPESGAPLQSAGATGSGLPRPELLAAIPRLRRYARVLTRDATSADDLVQDTLARAWEKRKLWRAGTDLRAWLFTIMHNVFVNQLARARSHARTVSLEAIAENGAQGETQASGGPIDRIELLEVARQLNRLPPEQREVLVLAAVEELRYDEIAIVLGIPVGTVMSRLSRARDKLRRMTERPPVARAVE